MKTEKNSQTKRRKKTGRRILQIILALIIILVIFVFLAVPALISSEKGRQMILARINKSVDGQTDFTDLSMGWFKGIRIADLSFNDHAGEISVNVKRIATEPHYGSLLAGNLSFGQTTIDEPRIQINLKDKPPAEITPGKETKSVPKETAGIALVTDIVVNNGNVKVTDTNAKTVELAQINTNVNLRPSGKQSSFDLNMIVAANNKESKIQVDGRITPVKTKAKSGWTLKGADGDLTVQVKELDLESLDSIFALAGVDLKAKGNISMDLKSQLKNGQLENVTGTIKGSQLEIATGQTQEKIQTSVLDVDMKLTRNGQMINIDNVQVKTDWAQIKAGGTMPTNLKSLDSFLNSDTNYDLNGTFDLDLATVVSQIPITLGLKEGTQISSGKITGNIKTIGSAGQKQLQAMAELADLSGSVEGKQISLSAPLRAEAQISPDKTGVNINNLVVSAPFAQINAAGNLEQVTFNGQADLAKLQSELGKFVDIGPYKIAGQFIEAGQVSLSDKTFTLSGSSTIKGLNITGPNDVTASVPTGEVTYALNIDRENNILNINSLNADMSFGQVNIKEAVVPLKKDSTRSLNATVRANNIDLGKLQPYAVMFASLPKETQLAGIADSEITVSSEKQTYIFKTDSTKIENLKLTYPGKNPFDQNSVSVAFQAEFNSEEKTYEIKNFQLDGPQIKIRYGRLTQKSMDGKTQLAGQIDCEYDWSALTALAGSYLPEDLMLQGTRKDRINFASEYPTDQKDQLMSNLSAKAGLGFEQASYMGLNFGPTDVNIVVQNGLLKIIPFATTVNEGQLNFGAQADFKEKPSLFRTAKPMQIMKDVKINDQTTKKLLKYINPIFADAANVNGIANLNCETLSIPLNSAAKNKAEIIGTVSVSQLRFQTSAFLGQILTLVGGGVRGTTITIHPTRFVLRDGFLRYDDMQMDIGDNPVNFKGVIGLDKSLEMSVTLPYTTEGRTIRIGSTSARRITLPITGTVDKPQLDVGKLLENQLKQELEQQILKGLDDIFG